MKRDFSNVKRVVVKLGTNILTQNNAIDFYLIERLAGQISSLHHAGKKVLLVSSGAIGIGAQQLKINRKITKTSLRQACAAIGQPMLMHRYRLAFQQYDIQIAQVLITKEIMDQRMTYNNLSTAVDTLLNLGVIPIFNENDCVSTAEIGPVFGDNDQLSAMIASKLEAELLVLLSDIDAFYDANPKENIGAKPLSVISEITPEIINCAGGAGSSYSTGGMKSKIKAVEIAQKAGCETIITHGRIERVLPRIMDGEPLGTLFLSKGKLKSRSRWILYATVKGRITVDEGAHKALLNRKSLLPSGIVTIDGNFSKGDVVLINDQFKAIAGSSSIEMQKMMGVHSKECKNISRGVKRDSIARSADIVKL